MTILSIKKYILSEEGQKSSALSYKLIQKYLRLKHLEALSVRIDDRKKSNVYFIIFFLQNLRLILDMYTNF